MEGAFSHVGKKIYYHFYPMVFLDSDMDLKSYYRDDSFYVDVTPKAELFTTLERSLDLNPPKSVKKRCKLI